MRTLLHKLVVLSGAAAFAACITSPQSPVQYEAFATTTLPGSFQAGEVTVALERAELAFGPLYFCAASSGSSTLCGSALEEMTEVARLDALSPRPQRLGTVRGYSGEIRSASFDYGLHWFDTDFAVTPSPSAPEGHSLVIEGTLAEPGQAPVPFRLAVDAVPQFQGQRAMPTSEAVASITSSAQRLEIRFDVEAWLRQIDFKELLRSGRRPLVLDAKSPAHDSVLIGLKVARPPEFRWIPAP